MTSFILITQITVIVKCSMSIAVTSVAENLLLLYSCDYKHC